LARAAREPVLAQMQPARAGLAFSVCEEPPQARGIRLQLPGLGCRHPHGIVAATLNLRHRVIRLRGADAMLGAGQCVLVPTVVFDERDDRLAGEVTPAYEHVGTVEPGGVQKLPPADL